MQSWLDAHVHVPEPVMSTPVGNGLLSHAGSEFQSPLLYALMGPPRLQSRHSENPLPSRNPDTSNGRQDEDVSCDMGNGHQDNDATFDNRNVNQSMNVSFDIANGNQDDHVSIDIGNGTQCRHVSFNIRDGIQNGRDVNDAVDAEVLELARAFQSLSTEGLFELVCINTALHPIHVHCSLDVGCILT